MSPLYPTDVLDIEFTDPSHAAPMNSTTNTMKTPPHQLDLSSEINIRMPFSSPMGDEILSPTSPTVPQSPIRSRKKNHRGEAGQEQNPSWNRRFSVQKSPKRNSTQKHGKSQNKTRWPGLNVVTNFSKPPILAQRAAEEGIRHHSGKEKSSRQNTQPGFGTTSDIKTQGDFKTHKRSKNSGRHIDRLEEDSRFRVECNEKKAQDEAAGLGLHPFDSPPDYGSLLFADGKSQVNSLKRSSTRITELSPSDRPIMIGITVPSAKFAELSISPDVGPTGLTTPNLNNRDPPMTPTIIVTPAKDQGPWSVDSYEQNQKFQNPRRAPSSVYSQAFHSRGVNQNTNTPPVPVPPPDFLPSKTNPSNTFDHKNGKDSPSRVVSSCTVFDEDDNQGRPMSGESHRRILKKSSTDSIATRHRSQGWWNHILSPFMTRTNTMLFRVGTPEVGGPVPPLPTSTQGGTARKQSSTSSNEISPPLVSKGENQENGRASVWTDFSRFEAEHQNIGLAFDHTPRSSTLVLNPAREMKNAVVPDAPIPFEGFGAAAEYYHAYWHDQNSSTPYFECQNHSCLPLKTNQPMAFDLDEDISRRILEDQNNAHDLSKIEMQREKSGFQQAPANRFSAAFSQAAKSNSRERTPSEVTDIEDLDATPEVHEAHVAPIVRAGAPTPAQPHLPGASLPRTVVSNSSARHLPETAGIAPSSKVSSKDSITSSTTPQKPTKRAVTVMPTNEPSLTQDRPLAPQPKLSSKLGRVPRKAVAGGRPNHENGSARKNKSARENMPQPPQNTYIVNHYYDNSNRRLQREEVKMANFDPPPRGEQRVKHSRERREKRDKRENNAYSRDRKQRKCLKYRNCFNKEKPMTKRKKRLLIGVAICLIILIILILALAMTLTRKGDKMQVQTQWLNITGFPPVPTGISTIIQPEAVQENSACVSPATLWSCALPKEDQQSIAPNHSDQPNFRVEISFPNETIANDTATATTPAKRSQMLNPVSAGHFIRSKALQIRDSFTSSLFSPSPSPPSQEDQAFLGNTTDKNAMPFDGETTPFFMSFLNPIQLPTPLRLVKRASANSSNPFGDPTTAIPPPDLNPDGTAASANLLPFPSSQPLRLYDRGLATEHYGFYTYFDRAIFLKSTSILEDSSTTGDVPDDRAGGAPEAAATVRCTWAQTRFLVQIWTNQAATTPLLGNSSSTTAASANHTNSATASTRPGSFPYPVTITLDRHGGDVAKKFIYCYALDNREHILSTRRKIQLENRGVGGVLVNPINGPFNTTRVSHAQGGPGGVDGGTGGCNCQWRNFGGEG